MRVNDTNRNKRAAYACRERRRQSTTEWEPYGDSGRSSMFDRKGSVGPFRVESSTVPVEGDGGVDEALRGCSHLIKDTQHSPQVLVPRANRVPTAGPPPAHMTN